MKRTVTYLSILIFSIIALSGCFVTDDKTNQYYVAAKEFYNIYFQVVKNVEINNDQKSIESLQSDDNLIKIAKLGELLETIKQTVPENRMPSYYLFKDRYDDLVFLRDLHGRNLNELSTEERRKLNEAITMIDTINSQ